MGLRFGRSHGFIKPPRWVVDRVILGQLHWEWAHGHLVHCFPFWPNVYTTDTFIEDLCGPNLAIDTIGGTPVQGPRERGTGLLLDETGDLIAFNGTSELLDMNSTDGWTVEIICFLDDYGTTGNPRFPGLIQLSTAHAANAEPWTSFCSEQAAYNGVNMGWRQITTSSGGGAKGDTVDDGLAGSQIDGHWSHLFIRYNGGNTDTLANFDCVYEGGAVSGVFVFANNGAFAAITDANRIAADTGAFDGQIALINLWQTRLTDGQCEVRIRNPFGFITMPRRIFSTAVPIPDVNLLGVRTARHEVF